MSHINPPVHPLNQPEKKKRTYKKKEKPQSDEPKKRIVKKKKDAAFYNSSDDDSDIEFEEKTPLPPPPKKIEYNEWGLDIPLFNHQKYSVEQMEWNEANPERIYKYPSCSNKIHTLVGFLADSVGSGKTLTTISFLARTKHINNTPKDDELVDQIINSKIRSFFSQQSFTSVKVKYIPVNLIVVSNSVFNQWVNELKHSNLTYRVIAKNADMVHPASWFGSVDCVVITYNRYKDFVSLLTYEYRNFNSLCLRRLIFDEIEARGRLPEMRAKNYWIISANISTNNYFYSDRDKRTNFVCDILGTALVQHVTVKNSREQMEESWRHAEVKNIEYDCFIRQFMAISSYLPNEVQRMIAADDMAGAISALGGTSESKSLYEIVVQKEEKAIKELSASLTYYTQLENGDKIKEYKQKLETARKTLEKLIERIRRNEEEECPVCCMEFEEKVLTNCCQGIICGGCIKALIQGTNKCPFCREKLNMGKMIVSKKGFEQIEEKTPIKQPRKNKLDTVIDIIKSRKDGKFLLFSESWNTFEQIKEKLEESNIKFAEVKGTTDAKQKYIREFKAGMLQVLFLNARFDGTGINLPETTDIILYHKISSPNLENQVLGRALRLGRTHPLTVHRLLSDQERTLSNDPQAISHLHSQQYNPADEVRRERERQEREDFELAQRLQNEM